MQRFVLSFALLAVASLAASAVERPPNILFAIAEAAEDIEPESVRTLQALWDNDFMPMAVGLVIFTLSSGIAIVRYGVLPKWLGWVAIVLAIVGITPIGFFAFLAGGLWMAIVSVMLALQARRPDAATLPTNIAVG